MLLKTKEGTSKINAKKYERSHYVIENKERHFENEAKTNRKGAPLEFEAPDKAARTNNWASGQSFIPGG